ncbi:serine/threonine protein kinase [Lusitaniella coriacea LEGE 07157]|uniref:Serine/threonine protein kinase n=1 Tax=Lusitaniella coriacea LEGE 07157 TaxID=945747 RepID=A0A8J7IXJ3_9CYAN|nr:serine/threonine-protein kinase [Lusitaniella coriacea]MBE9118798.1 serine/threonine protein kinase [Lusitaniella coriacea LEGE 07157]
MLQVGDVLRDRYQLKQQLSENPVHSTWLAEYLTAPDISQKPVIIKLLAFGGQVHWDHLKLFEREAQVLQNLNHPRIPQYRDYFSIDDRALWFGLVEDYIPGLSLKESLARNKTLKEQEVRQIAIDILEILIYLHGLNPPVLHRDIKPSNIIIGEDKQVYLVDFGAVQSQPTAEGSTFTVVGTYGYTPMEQFGGRSVPASDLYALGATLIHLLTGVAPANLPQQNFRIQFTRRVSLSPSLTRWIEKLIEPDLEERFPSASQALNALKSGIMPDDASSLATQPLKPPIPNNSGCGKVYDPSVPVPDEIQGWNWGAFFLPGFWPLTNQVWMGLLAWTPYFGWLVGLALGIKGNEWAWKSRRWRSIEHFKAHQRGWAIAGLFVGIPMAWISLFVLTTLLQYWLHF